MADRTITVILKDGIPDPDYAKMANAIWSVASLAGNDFVGVLPDGGTPARFLNDWYDKEDGEARWS